MASADYTRGKMDISEQSRTWSGFLTGTVWGTGLLLIIVAYLTFTLTLGMHWMVALVLCAGAGIVGGLLLGMGGTWLVTVVGLAALAVFVQVIIFIAGLLISG